MPQPPSPPFVPGAQTSPRQLNRWIDINPQGGALERTKTFLSLPAFSQAVSWKGYSEIVLTYNFEGPNAFSLRNFPTVIGTNFALAIMWVSNNVTHRYWLISGVGEVIYFPQILYTGQVIKKNFRLEVWSTNSSPAVSSGIPIMMTSVLGNIDYMWGLDSNLVLNDLPGITNFQNIGGSPGLPTDIGIAYHWQPSGIQIGAGITSWIDSIANNSLVPVVGNPTAGAAPNGAHAMNSFTGNLNSNFTTFNQTFNTIAFGFQFRNVNGNLISDSDNDNVLNLAGTTLTLKNQGNTVCTITGLVNLSWYVVVMTVNTLYVYNMSTGILLGSSSGAAAIGTATTIQYGGNGNIYVDLLFGLTKGTSSDAQAIANYFTSTYFSGTVGVWNLPLTFPPNSVPANN